jgi:hypothetical protein
MAGAHGEHLPSCSPRQGCERAWQVLEVTGRAANALTSSGETWDLNPDFDRDHGRIDFAIPSLDARFARYNPAAEVQEFAELTGIAVECIGAPD